MPTVPCLEVNDRRFRARVAMLAERERSLADGSLHAICRALLGAFPAVAVEAMAHIPNKWLEEQPASRTTLDVLMPEPHPVDCDWRFDAPTAEFLALNAATEGRSLCLGTPSVFTAIAARGGGAHLVDRNPFLARYIACDERCTFENGDVATIAPTNEKFRTAVLDPPWYLGSYDLFIRHAVDRLARPGILFVTLFRELTRPGAADERSQLLARLRELGRTSILDRAAVYTTPRFEEEVLRRLRLPALPAWRAADIVRVDVGEAGEWNQAPTQGDAEPTWRRFLLGDQVVAVMDRPGDDVPIHHEAPPTSLLGYELESVSRRDPARGGLTIWTSRNRAAIAQGTTRIAACLAEVADQSQAGWFTKPALTEGDHQAFADLAADLDIPSRRAR